MNPLNHGYGERSSCLAWDYHIRSRVMAIEVIVFVFGSVGSLVGTLSVTVRSTNWLFSLCLDLCGSLVGTLSGICPIHQDVIVAPQFVI